MMYGMIDEKRKRGIMSHVKMLDKEKCSDLHFPPMVYTVKWRQAMNTQ
jgi:hypothetical protein